MNTMTRCCAALLASWALLAPACAADQDSVYFDHDSLTVRAADQAVLERWAASLRSQPRRVILQGHSDQRSGPEYALALGQRRADAVRAALLARGVAPDLIETVSVGRERPRERGHTAAARAANRRVDLLPAR
jgi:peptidoglycan-associated lipoprotein